MPTASNLAVEQRLGRTEKHGPQPFKVQYSLFSKKGTQIRRESPKIATGIIKTQKYRKETVEFLFSDTKKTKLKNQNKNSVKFSKEKV